MIELDQNVACGVATLDTINKHDFSPAGVLGMNKLMSESIHTQVPEALGRTFENGVHLLTMDEAGRAILRTMSLGSIVSFLPQGFPLERITSRNIEALLAYETLAIVIEHTVQGTILFGVTRKPRLEEKSIGKWGTYQVNSQDYSEKTDAINALKRLFHPTEGIEASQMLSKVFNLRSFSTETITSSGCYSHEKPKKAIPENFLLGFCKPTSALVISENSSLIMKCIRNVNGILEPLDSNKKVTMPTDHLMAVAFLAQAESIAVTNPKNLGKGTDPLEIVEAMMQVTPTIVEIAANGGRVVDAQRELRSNLGVVTYV
jgi:hypothetical protein